MPLPAAVLWGQLEGTGLHAIAEGFRQLGYIDDHAINAAEWIVYDALYAYCQETRSQALSGTVCQHTQP